VFRALRRQRSAAAQFLSLSPGELRRRYFWLGRHLGLEGPAAAAYFAGQPCLLLAEPEQAAAVVSSSMSVLLLHVCCCCCRCCCNVCRR
jgi:hypothetical protein